MPQLQNETVIYSIINENQPRGELPIAPTFLGHLTENGRVIGFLLEKAEGTSAAIEDLPKCEKVLGQLHDMGLIHGDVNRYNFIVNRSNGHVRMVDFEHAKPFDEEQARLELESLTSELVEDTGRGGPTRVVEMVASA